MNIKLKRKLSELPKSPGVYFHKNSQGEIIYVGKAAVLKNRVRQYFQASRYRDPKTELLVSEIADVDWIVVGSEAEALFLEAEMVKRYMPRYNILLRDDKSSVYIRINIKDIAPTITVIRRPLGDDALYFGPFLQAGAVHKALRYLRKAFPFSTHTVLPKRGCLDYHLGLCPGPETASYDRDGYIKNLKQLILFITGKKDKVIKRLDSDMKLASRRQNYEQAALLRNKLIALKALQNQVLFGDNESLDLSKDFALNDLGKLLGLNKPLRRIEAYDISHIQGTDTVASMVVFANGAPQKSAYRKFKMRIKGNDDFAHMAEVITRRFSTKNIKSWDKPDLILIDGGKGQLTAAVQALGEASVEVPIIGLSKRNEEIILSKSLSRVNFNELHLQKLKGYSSPSTDFLILALPPDSHAIKLLQRIRDESHRFAISYHSVLRQHRQTESLLDAIPGFGPATKRKLIVNFGSLKVVLGASKQELSLVIGESKAKILVSYFAEHNNNSGFNQPN